MRSYWIISTLVLGLTLTSGCSGNAGQAGCEDLVRTIGDVAERCGFDRVVNEEAAEANVNRYRGCEAVGSLRDEAAFYDDCLPYVENLTCTQFDDPGLTFPASCAMQLELD